MVGGAQMDVDVLRSNRNCASNGRHASSSRLMSRYNRLIVLLLIIDGGRPNRMPTVNVHWSVIPILCTTCPDETITVLVENPPFISSISAFINPSITDCASCLVYTWSLLAVPPRHSSCWWLPATSTDRIEFPTPCTKKGQRSTNSWVSLLKSTLTNTMHCIDRLNCPELPTQGLIRNTGHSCKHLQARKWAYATGRDGWEEQATTQKWYCVNPRHLQHRRHRCSQHHQCTPSKASQRKFFKWLFPTGDSQRAIRVQHHAEAAGSATTRSEQDKCGGKELGKLGRQGYGLSGHEAKDPKASEIEKINRNWFFPIDIDFSFFSIEIWNFQSKSHVWKPFEMMIKNQ